MMSVRELGESFAEAFNAGDFDTVASYLADDFQFSGPVPEPISGQQWLGLTKLMRAAFPDIQYRMRVVDVEGDVVTATNQLSGTHTGDLDLSAMGMGVIPATGKSFSNPEEVGRGVVRGDKLASIHITPVEGGGLMGILAQLGIKPPA
jgi:predicted ester cyclase